jgi:16S rRNA (guanine527-N7)-methyltransferase
MMQALLTGCERLGIALDQNAAQRLLSYRDHLLQANQHLNLTSITDPEEALHKHLIDSLAPLALPTLVPGGLWVDVGSGGGLPGMALALARPGQKVVLVEATQKKAGFLEEAVRAFALQNQVQVLARRAEELGQDPAWRGKADAVFFKAVGSLAEILELGLPLLKRQGLLVAMKGPKAEEEIVHAAKALQVLGGKVEARRAYTLQGGEQRRLVLVRKTTDTPPAYPRANGMPKNRPLQ